MLSFTDGKPIAIIKGGKYNSKIVYLDQEQKKENKIAIDDPYEYMEEDEIRGISRSKNINKMNAIEFAKLKRSILMNREPENDELNEVYKVMKKELPKKISKELNLYDDGIIQMIPNIDGSERLYVAGPTGSGKSYFISKYIEQFTKLFKDAPIYLFSDQDSDEVLDKFSPIRVKINESLLENPIKPEELSVPKIKNPTKPEDYDPVLVIFDDTDSIEDKKISVAVSLFRDTLLKRGRHFNLYTICSSHQITDYKNTRIILNEVSMITVFPKSGSTNGINRVLGTYCGLNSSQIKRIFDLPSRWVSIFKNYPMYVMYEKGIYLL